MNEQNRTGTVLSSLDAFQALRIGLAYLRSFSVIFEDKAELERLGLSGTEDGSGEDAQELPAYCARAAICTYIALLYAALCHYTTLVERNTKLRYDELDARLRLAQETGLFERMRQLRNAVFHVRPNIRPEPIVQEIVARTGGTGALSELEHLLYDATEKIFCSPEELFQETEEVLMQGFQDALDYYEQNLSEPPAE